MNNEAKVKKIFIDTMMQSIRSGKSEAEAEKDAVKAVKDAGWYLKKGKWNKSVSTTNDRTAFKNRSDENKKLASIKVKPMQGMA